MHTDCFVGYVRCVCSIYHIHGGRRWQPNIACYGFNLLNIQYFQVNKLKTYYPSLNMSIVMPLMLSHMYPSYTWYKLKKPLQYTRLMILHNPIKYHTLKSKAIIWIRCQISNCNTDEPINNLLLHIRKYWVSLLDPSIQKHILSDMLACLSTLMIPAWSRNTSTVSQLM